MKFNYIFIATMITIAAIHISGCESKKGDLAVMATGSTPVVTCDSLNSKYSVQVKNIISANCYSCHATPVATALGGGIVLDTYNGLNFWATNGILLDNITQVPGSNPMPKNAAKLSDCDIAKIRVWINSGSPNN